MRRYSIPHAPAVVVALLALLAVLSGCGQASPPQPPGPAQLRSAYENARGVSIGRDCGYSQPDPGRAGRSIWLFCDTPVFTRGKTAQGRAAWGLQRFITGSTAAEAIGAPGHLPGRLTELPTPASGPAPPGAAQTGGPPAAGAQSGGAPAGDRGPARFLPQPLGLVTLAGQPCIAANGGYSASWISGTARIPGSADLLITYDNYCVITGANPGFIPEGFGIARYDPAANRLAQNPVFTGTGFSGAAAAELLGSPVFRGGYLYLYGPACSYPALGGCGKGEIAVARVPASPLAWADPLAYRWWNALAPGGSWTPDVAAATSVIPAAKPAGVSVADFSADGRGLVLVEQTDVAGRFTVYQSPAPAGPWTRLFSARVPCAVRPGFANFCRAVNPHPELSTRSWLMLSYFDPAASPDGHVMIDGFRWLSETAQAANPRAHRAQVPRCRSTDSSLAVRAFLSPARRSALRVRLTRGALAATASTARLTTSITSSQSPSTEVNIASVRLGSPLSRTTRTASATYSLTPSPAPIGVTENATIIAENLPRSGYSPMFAANPPPGGRRYGRREPAARDCAPGRVLLTQLRAGKPGREHAGPPAASTCGSYFGHC